MVEPIDVDKLKNDAISAIDILFGDDDDDSLSESFTEPASDQVPEEKVMPDSFATLKEDLLTMDWEYSDDSLKSFLSNLNRISTQYTDRYSQALVKMIKSVAVYLDQAREKAYPETMNILPVLIKTLQEINTADFDHLQVAPRVKAVYETVLNLRKKISHYNRSVRTPGMPSHHQPVQESLGQTDSDQTALLPSQVIDDLKRHEDRISMLEAQNRELKQIIVDLQSQNIAAPTPAAIEAEESPAEPEFNFGETESSDEPVESISFEGLEDAESSEVSESISESLNLDSGIDTDEEDEIQFQFEQTGDEEGESIVLDDLEYDEIEQIDPELIEYDSEDDVISEADLKTEETDITDLDDGDIVTEEEPEIHIESQEDVSKSESASEKVHCYKIDDEAVAFPQGVVNNIYKIPPKQVDQLKQASTIELKALSSGMFFKLSKGMRGPLENIAENELKTMTVPIKRLKEGMDTYTYAVLCAYDQRNPVIVPVSENFDDALFDIQETKQLENAFSQTIVNIDNQGTIPLIDPCK